MTTRWRARLELNYRRDGDRCVASDRHEGPLRVLKALYPEGGGICHHVLVHPPGGVVGGDRLELDVSLAEDTHAVITTPGATRFYRSDGPLATQQIRLQVGNDARLEWLPQETIAHCGCRAESSLAITLAPKAELLGWELLSLGAPAAGEAFDRGSFVQHLEYAPHWLEHGTVRGDDRLLLDSPLGWDGRSSFASLWFAAGRALETRRREALLDAARAACGDAAAGATAVHDQVIVVRALGHRVEPLMQLLRTVRARWRALAWGLDEAAPRIWQT